eukprot:TRINITY_DN16311_c0_g1_i1.p1 TRINITY_DN16311_c0_g1~~TRINITY_DN16311_c0_g1_i1.p1  ORF type:complete len:278 (+),score=21.87 TRINITY_DN16311_c0_g1_i1:16-849(+)
MFLKSLRNITILSSCALLTQLPLEKYSKSFFSLSSASLLSQPISPSSLFSSQGSPKRDPRNVFYPLAASNGLVYLASYSPNLQPFIYKHFFLNTSNIASGRLHTLLTSSFCHVSFIHFFVNMYVLYTFMPGAYQICNRDPIEFMKVYLGGGFMGGFLSMIKKFTSMDSRASVGASGSICSLLILVGLKYPDSQFGVVFLPESVLSFDALTGLCVFFAIELVGLLILRKRSPIDHAGHLGGALFGLGYYFLNSSERERQSVKARLIWKVRRLLGINYE